MAIEYHGRETMPVVGKAATSVAVRVTRLQASAPQRRLVDHPVRMKTVRPNYLPSRRLS